MKPALTPEQWADFRARGNDDSYEWPLDNDHATAALCLYGQPFGFTREDLTCLRYVMASLDHHGIPQPCLESLADRIAALLPPEEEG